MRVLSASCLASAVAFLGAAPVFAGQRFHTIRQRPSVRMPAPHKLAVKRRTVRIPGRPSQLFVYLQLRTPHGKLSPVVAAGQPVETTDDNGTKLVRSSVTARYDPKHHRLRYVLSVRNLAISRKYAKQLKVGFLVTIRYRGKR